MLFTLVFGLSILLSTISALPMSDREYMEFIRGWAASCIDSLFPEYVVNELSVAVRKCQTEQCVFKIYKLVADTEKKKFREFDICFESNTRLNNQPQKIATVNREPPPKQGKYVVAPPQWNDHYKSRRSTHNKL